MSATVSNPAEGSTPDLSCGPLALEIVRLTPSRGMALHRFFKDINASGDSHFFRPHATDEEAILKLAEYTGQDLHYVLVDNGGILGYGLLRGWDEGYKVPSLGIAVHPSARGLGIGRMLMVFLHITACRKGAEKVRLRVHLGNDKAMHLYKSLGYIFESDSNDVEYLVGLKQLKHA
ncbi:MAG: GNAT family N-acetyltransferase [Hydrogenophaga sp.]|uniref:GNAT family N-acetyltransferase n=1 Tax=Hydrogenophaga sp. TaxID=1904254 RepID=UPI002ABB5887|nr:GNAT family N-acetyltransferase [Hydrogenophaga sp.]MDZ4101091.1 GNAT family N-acetyltransferase [Hydrogenophaga sp.]